MKSVATHTTPHTEASKRLMSLRRIGKYLNDENPNWKGDAVGYIALHAWVARKLGKPQYCEDCESTTKGRYHWANISGNYARDLDDWKRLCASCHYKYDGLGQKRWANHVVVNCLEANCLCPTRSLGLCARHYLKEWRQKRYA